MFYRNDVIPIQRGLICSGDGFLKAPGLLMKPCQACGTNEAAVGLVSHSSPSLFLGFKDDFVY